MNILRFHGTDYGWETRVILTPEMEETPESRLKLPKLDPIKNNIQRLTRWALTNAFLSIITPPMIAISCATWVFIVLAKCPCPEMLFLHCVLRKVSGSLYQDRETLIIMGRNSLEFWPLKWSDWITKKASSIDADRHHPYHSFAYRNNLINLLAYKWLRSVMFTYGEIYLRLICATKADCNWPRILYLHS